MRAQGLPIDTSIIKPKPTPQLDTTRVKFHKGYMEDFREDAAVDFIFSFSVMEHVEDLEGFYRECNRILKPGTYMVHIVDLGGHGVFEDPLPPLDFQTYADWLHDWMFPK